MGKSAFHTSRRGSGHANAPAKSNLDKIGSAPAFFQLKPIATGKQGDPFEREADAAADDVLRGRKVPEVQAVSSLDLQQQAVPEEEMLQMQSEMEEEEMLQMQSEAASPASGKSTLKPVSISRELGASGAGKPLPPAVLQEMNTSFGADFSGVRIHESGAAHRMNSQLKAQAFTTGNNVFFNKGKFSPQSAEGKHLLAHELTHVLQQQKGKHRNLQLKKEGEQTEGKSTLEGMSNWSDLLKNAMGVYEDKTDEQDPKALGKAKFAKNAMGFLSEFAKRRAKGESVTQAASGGFLKIGIDAVTGSEIFLKQIKGKASGGKAALLASGLKALGFNRAGDIVDLASKMSRSGLVGQGIQEGFTGLFDLIYNAALGKPGAVADMQDQQVKGDYGPITQGYAMVALLISDAALGDFSASYQMLEKAGRGELGTLAQIGDRLGAATFDAQQRLGETWDNRATDDQLRGTPKQRFEQMSVGSKSEAIHHLITGYTSKGDLIAIEEIMSTVKSKKDRDYICSQYEKRLYSLNVYDRLKIEMALGYHDYQQERSGAKTGFFNFHFNLEHTLESRRFFVGNGKVTADIKADSQKVGSFDVQLFREKHFDFDISHKAVAYKTDGSTYSYTWSGLGFGNYYFVIKTKGRISGAGKVFLK